MNNYDSYEKAKKNWNHLWDNRRLKNIIFIVYIRHDDLDRYIHSGWLYECDVNAAKNICTFVVVPKNIGLSLSETTYKKLLNLLCYKLKKRIVNEKINNLVKDFAYDV